MKQWTYCPIDNWNYSTHPQDSHGHIVASVRLGYKICERRESVANLIKYSWKSKIRDLEFVKICGEQCIGQPITNSQKSATKDLWMNPVWILKKIWTRRWRLKKLGKWFNKSTNLEPMWPVSTHAPMNGTKFSWRRSRIWKSIVENADNNYFAFLANQVAYIHTYCTSMELILGHSKSYKLMCSFIILAGNCHFIA